MSDLDIALRLRLENQLSRSAEEAERDLKALQRAAEQLGRTRGGNGLSRELEAVERSAEVAKREIGEAERQTEELRRALGRVDQADGLRGVKTDADRAGRSVQGLERDANQARQALGRVDDSGGLDNVKADADAAARSVKEVGDAAERSERQLRQLGRGGRRAQRGQPWGPVYGYGEGTSVIVPPPNARSRGGRDVGEGILDRTGADAIVPLGAGAAYAAGSGAAAVAVGGTLAYRNYAGFNREMGLLGNTAGVPMETVESGIKELRGIANDAALPLREAFEGFRALLETGMSWRDALDAMPSIARTTTASGANAASIAVTQRSGQQSLGLSIADMPMASDIMIAGGNAGQFELRDMAAYLPSLLAAAASREGFTGLEGLSSIIASAQILRARTGSPGSAATQLENVLLKMDSPETKNNFADYGIDLSAELDAAVTAGADPINALLDQVDKALAKGAQLNELFRDTELYLGVNSLRQGREERDALQAELMESQGATDTNFNRLAGDAQSAIDLLSNAFRRLTYSVGEALHNLGVTTGVNITGEAIDSFAADPLGIAPSPLRYLRPLKPEPETPEGRAVEAYQEYARTRVIGRKHAEREERAQRLKELMGPNFMERAEAEAAARDAMDGYQQELAAGGEEAEGIVQSIVDTLKSMLNFNAGPTITPRFNAPAPAGEAGGKPIGDQSSAVPKPSARPVSVTQYISAPSSRLAARAAQREQNRAVRMAQADALGDVGLA